MLQYSLKRIKNTESKNPKVARTKNGKIILLSKRAVYNKKKIKIYQRTRSSTSLGINTPLIKILNRF